MRKSMGLLTPRRNESNIRHERPMRIRLVKQMKMLLPRCYLNIVSFYHTLRLLKKQFLNIHKV